MINTEEDSVLLTEVEQLADDQLYRSIKEKEQQYQKVFEELSIVRSEMRVVKQENAWMRTVKVGLEEEVATLKDILRQKKQIISNMGDELNQKNQQLTEMEKQLNAHFDNEEELLGKLEQYEKCRQSIEVEIEQLRVQTDRLTEVAVRESSMTPPKTRVDQQTSPIVNRQDQVRLTGQIDRTIVQMEGLFRKLSFPPGISSPHRSLSSPRQDSSSTLQRQVETLLTFNSELMLQSERLNRQLQARTSNSTSTQGKVMDLQKRACSLDLENHQLNLELEKSRHTQKFAVERVALLQNEFAKVVSHNDQRLEQAKREYESVYSKYEQCRAQRQAYRRQTLESLSPILKPFLPEELIHLVKKLQETPSQHTQQVTILERQIEKLATLQACRQKHNEKLEMNQQHIKRQMVQLEGENDLLRIKLSNLQRAYQNAVEDYRRSIRFSTATKKRQEPWSTTSNKQNTFRNC